MTDYLKSIGFKKAEVPDEDAEAEDPTATRMKGTITVPSAHDGERLIANFLGERRIQSVLLVPEDFKLPEEPEKPVKVQMQLAANVPPGRQRLLAEQTRAKLAQLGFREAVAYDNRAHTRLAGTIPAGELETLLKDLRWEPSGWLTPAVAPSDLPVPLRLVSPVVVIEVVSEPEGTPPGKEPPPPPAEGRNTSRSSPRASGAGGSGGSGGAGAAGSHPEPYAGQRWTKAGAACWRGVAPGMVMEGRLGPLVTADGFSQAGPALAQLPIVSVVRLPRPAWPPVRPTDAAEAGDVEALRASGLDRLHALGGAARAFGSPWWTATSAATKRFVKNKQLPAGTRYVDLTAERNFNLQPDDVPERAARPSATAPSARWPWPWPLRTADLTLIRIDPAAPYQLQDVARHINGETVPLLQCCAAPEELIADAERLRQQRNELSVRAEGLPGKLRPGSGLRRSPGGVPEEGSRRGGRGAGPARPGGAVLAAAARPAGTAGDADRLVLAGLGHRLSGGGRQPPQPLLRRPAVPRGDLVPGGRQHPRPDLVGPVP